MPLMIACEARICGKPLMKPGALLFGPRDEKGNRRKVHLCDACFPTFLSIAADDRALMGYERRQPMLYSPPSDTGVVKEYDVTTRTFEALAEMLR